jgi:mono/diheme cytochrome c family protein
MMRLAERASMKCVALSLILSLSCAPAGAQDKPSFTKDQVEAGAEIYSVNCSPCHGARMQDAGSAFNLRKFPSDQRERFVTSVTGGKGQMPPWGDFFKSDQLDALWAYVTAGER